MKYRLTCAVMLALSLWACGQKGALYLPDRNGSVITRPGGSSAPRVPPPPGQPASAPIAAPQSTPATQEPGDQPSASQSSAVPPTTAPTPGKPRDPAEINSPEQPPR